MSIFGVYALICTFLLLVYYMVTIWFDLHGSKGSKKEEAETIDTGDMVDTETSTEVRELGGGGYQLGSGEFEDEPYEQQVQVEPPVELGGDSEESPTGGLTDSSSEENNEGDASDGPSVYERAKQVHDEGCHPVPKEYEMQLMGAELMAKLTTPFIQKNEVHRNKLYC